MRTIALALLAFLLAGVAIAVSRFELSTAVSDGLGLNTVQLVFEPELETVEQDLAVTISRARPDGVLLLGRSSSTQTAHFPMLRDATVTSGVLHLQATSQIGPDETSVLRIFVGNEIRGEVLLAAGQRRIDTEIGLTSKDLASEELAIRYVMTRPQNDGSCTQNGEWSNIIEIEQDSNIVLEVEDAKLTPRDRVAAWGEEVLVGWPQWLTDEQRHIRSSLAMELAALGYAVRYVDAPNTQTMSVAEMRGLIAGGRAESRRLIAEPEWPQAIAQTGSNSGARWFQGSTQWRHWYRIGPDHFGSAPTAFDYELLLGSLPGEAHWTVSVTHNGSIIDVREVPGTSTTLTGNISLENLSFEPSNVIEVSAVSSYETTGLCNNGPDLLAELRSGTQLLGGGEDISGALEDLKVLLGARQPITIDLDPDLSLVEMQRMQDLVEHLVSDQHKLAFEDQTPTIKAVRRSDFATILPDLPAQNYVVWIDDTDHPTAVQARSLRQDGAQGPVGALALIVSLGDPLQSSLVFP